MEGSNLQKIEKLLHDDEDFFLLKKIRPAGRSIFHIICKEFDELTFSRTLKFFIDPQEDHNLGDYFLKRFLLLLIKNRTGANEIEPSLSRLDIDLMNLQDTKVYREYGIGKLGRIDIFMEIPGNLEVIIECKMLSTEGKDQTKRYAEWILSKGNSKTDSLLCYLTPDGVSPESTTFIPLAYGEIYAIFNDESIIKSLSHDNQYLLRHFLQWMRGYMGNDKETTDLCRRIYTKYKDELDLIFSSMPTLKSFYQEVADEINSKAKSKYLAHSGGSWLIVSPISWLAHKELKDSSKYSLPRMSVISYGEKQYFNIVTPQEGGLYDLVQRRYSKLLTGNNDNKAPFKDWGKLYFPLEVIESFDPVSIIANWDETVKEYAATSIRWVEKIHSEFTEEELLTSLK